VPYLTDLADAARLSGLPVVEVAGWKTRGHGPITSVRGTVCHWTATADSAVGDYPSLPVVRDGRSGLPGPLCNLGLGRGGTVYVVAAGLAYHAGEGYWPGIGSNGNANLLGVEAEDNGDGRWTAAMLDAYPRLNAALTVHYGYPLGLNIGHNEWAPDRKVDIRSWPGGMAGFRNQVAAVLAGPPRHVPMEDDVMYIKCEKNGGTAILSGPIFVGLGSDGELTSAAAAIAAGAPVQWVEPVTWNALDARSHALYDRGPGIPVRTVGA
jgi:hypothetical protein